MKIEKINYSREIESMGNLIVLFRARIKNRHWEANNHYMYVNNENKSSHEAKNPLDLAIYPSSSSIEYVSFFVEDEMLTEDIKYDIGYKNDSILIIDERFTFDKRYIDVKMEFNQYIQNRDVFVISKEAKKNLIGYRLDDDHYILFDDEDNFSGVVFKNLTDKQMEELKKSNVI